MFNPRVVHTLNKNLGNIISVPAPHEINVDDRSTTKKDEKTTIEIPAENNNTTAPVVSESTNDSFNQKMIEETAKALQEAFDRDVEEKTRKILAGENSTTTVSTVKEINNVIIQPVHSEITASSKTNKTENTLTSDNKSTVALKKFHVIGGVFSIIENANNYINKAKADGYPAVIAGKNKRGYWVVSLASANSENELQSELQNIQITYEKNAWVYEK